jgi:hypothetical protein
LDIDRYPFSAGRRSADSIQESIAELAVDYAVRDVEEFVIRVERVMGGRLLETVYERQPITDRERPVASHGSAS